MRAFIIACIALTSFLVLSVVIGSRPASVTLVDYKLLQPGIAFDESVHLLHGPPRNDLDRRAVIWVPQHDGRRLSAFVEPGTLSQNFFPGSAGRGRREVWITKSGLIAVDFGSDGRLRGKYFSEVNVIRGPTVWGWIASRPEAIRRDFGWYDGVGRKSH